MYPYTSLKIDCLTPLHFSQDQVIFLMASLDDYLFFTGFKCKHVKLTTKNSSFTGTVQFISQKKIVVLEDVVEVRSGRKLAGAKIFFGYEILNIELHSISKHNTVESSGDLIHLVHGHLSVSEPCRCGFGDDYEDEQNMTYVILDDFQKFGSTVMHISQQQVIGTGADGAGEFQDERLCWLQIATKNTVYFFDILVLGDRAFKNGLSMILESSRILKVIHDCRSIAGRLLAQFGVKLTNVFDTQVADIMHFYEETGGFLPNRVSTLQEVVSLHLKIPLNRLSSLEMKTPLTRKDREDWYVRPCSAQLLKVLALSVIHLQRLRFVLLDALLSDYTSLVDSYLSSSHNVHVQDVGKSTLETPKELRKLEVIRKKRQQWALSHYTVTENGLLERQKVTPSSEAETCRV